MTTTEACIATADDPRWRALISGQMKGEYRCLALRIMMIRIRSEYDRDARALGALTDELRVFFINNARFAAADYRAIFGGGAR